MEEHSGQLDFLHRPEKPIHREDLGGHRDGADVIAVDMKAAGDLDAARFAPAAPELESALDARPGVLVLIVKRKIGTDSRGSQDAGLKHAQLSDYSTAGADFEPLLDSDLRLP